MTDADRTRLALARASAEKELKGVFYDIAGNDDQIDLQVCMLPDVLVLPAALAPPAPAPPAPPAPALAPPAPALALALAPAQALALAPALVFPAPIHY